MKQIEYAPAVEMSMSALTPEGVRRVQAWFDYLRRWDEDEVVRKNALPLPGHEGVYLLLTTTDLRIFFRIDGDTITVLDVTTQAVINASAGISVGGSAAVGVAPGETKP